MNAYTLLLGKEINTAIGKVFLLGMYSKEVNVQRGVHYRMFTVIKTLRRSQMFVDSRLVK